MKKLLLSLVVAAMMLLMGSCGSSKDVVYWQNIDSISLAASRGLYEAKIMPKDELLITVSTVDPQAAVPFNLAMTGTMGAGGSLNGGAGSLITYLVDNDGYINFPVVGRIHVEGLTKPQVEDIVAAKVRPFLAKGENPIVKVRMSSYRVVVIGAIGSTVIPVNQEKMSIVEAIAQAGDLNIQGRRDNILLIREDASGEKHHVRLDMRDANLFNSPYYYLQQNDIIYVEPNNQMTKGASIGPSTSLWFSFIGIATSLTSLIVNILR